MTVCRHSKNKASSFKLQASSFAKNRGFTIMETLMVIVLMTVVFSVFGTVFSSAYFLRKSAYVIQASNFVREELDSLRTLPFDELINRTNDEFLGISLTRGPWKVKAATGAPSGANVLAMETAQTALTSETGQIVVPGNYRKDMDTVAKFKVLSASPAGWGAGIAFHYRDSENHYRFRIRSGGIALDKVYHGTISTLWSQSATYNTDTWYTLEIVTSGSDITLKKNGTTLTTVTDTTFSKGDVTLTTLNGAKVYVDDVSVTESGVAASWNFDGDTTGSLPKAWQRFVYVDLPSGAGTLTISDYLGQSTLKQCSATVTWSDSGFTRSMTGTTLITR